MGENIGECIVPEENAEISLEALGASQIYDLARDYSRNQDYENAIICYAAAEEKYSKNGVSFSDRQYSNYGYALLKESQFDKAVTVLEKGESIDPNNPLILLHLGTALTELGRYEKAFQKLEALNNLEGLKQQTKENVLRHLGALFLKRAKSENDPIRKGDFLQRAKEYYENNLQIDSNDSKTLQALTILNAMVEELEESE